MNMFGKLCVMGGFVLALSGCATTGNFDTGVKITPAMEKQLVDGKTTQKQVTKIVGDAPDYVQHLGDGETVWHYDFAHSATIPFEKSTQETYLMTFNKQGVLTSHKKKSRSERYLVF